jgi:sec-independent protein translocase protein TatA
MNFLDMGIGEILLVLFVALIVFGPGKIPEIARMLGRAVGALRRASFDLTSQIKKELEEEEKTPRSQLKTSSGDKPAKPAVTETTKPDDTDKTGSGER